MTWIHAQEIVLAIVAAAVVAAAGHAFGRCLHWLENRVTIKTIKPHSVAPNAPYEPQSFIPVRSLKEAQQVASQAAIARAMQNVYPAGGGGVSQQSLGRISDIAVRHATPSAQFESLSEAYRRGEI